MEHTARDRRIAEALGLTKEWMKPNHGSCCTCQICGWNITDFDVCKCVDFSTAEGMLTILQEGPKVLELWPRFMESLSSITRYVEMVTVGRNWRTKEISYDYYIRIDVLQDPNRLANEFYEFLRKEER